LLREGDDALRLMDLSDALVEFIDAQSSDSIGSNRPSIARARTDGRYVHSRFAPLLGMSSIPPICSLYVFGRAFAALWLRPVNLAKSDTFQKRFFSGATGSCGPPTP
jgi:hypothetical protein